MGPSFQWAGFTRASGPTYFFAVLSFRARVCVFFAIRHRHGMVLATRRQINHLEKLAHRVILQVPTTQLVKMSIDPKFVELTADVL